MAISFHHQTLPNGLTILAETSPEAHTAGVGFFVKTGTRDEDRPVMGVSHFLEHMMFKGTARRSAEAINREFDDLGANYNAYTSHDNTVYFAQVLPELLPKAVDLLGDMLRPALREEDFTVEKNVILEEIGMYEDRPQWRLQDAIMEAYFVGHPLSYRVLGTKQSIEALTAQQMRDYFATHYSADHIIVAAAGKLEFSQLVDDLSRLTATWAPQGLPRRYDQPETAAVQRAMADAKLTRHYVSLMSPAPSAQDPRRHAAAILADVLGDSEGSQLYWALIDPGLADEADFSHYAGDQVGAFSAFASCDPERADQVQDLLVKTIDGLADTLNPEEVERAKNKVATHATLRGERPMGRMMNLGSQWLFLNQYVPMELELERLVAVTPDDIRGLIAQMPFTSRTIVRLGPAVS